MSIGTKHYSLEQLATVLVEIEFSSLGPLYMLMKIWTLASPLLRDISWQPIKAWTSRNADCQCDEDYHPTKDSATKMMEIWKKQLYLLTLRKPSTESNKPDLRTL